MSSNTKIVVLRSKELVYALVLVVVSVLIIMVAVSLFMPPKDGAATPSAPVQNAGERAPQKGSSRKDLLPGGGISETSNLYVPGIYSSTMLLGNSTVELQITVDKDHINSISMANIDESVATLYPLMGPTLESLSATILEEQSIDNVGYSTENRYTSMLLIQTISATLDKARVSENADRPGVDIVY